MYKAAMQLAREASVEELLGNLTDAQKHYSNAKLLIEAVMITVTCCIHCVRVTRSLLLTTRPRIPMIAEIYYFSPRNSVLAKLSARSFSSSHSVGSGHPHLVTPVDM